MGLYSSRSKSSSECISDLTLVTQRDRDRSKWAGAMGGTLGKPAGLRGSAGAGLSCLRTCPGLGEVLPPFLETGLRRLALFTIDAPTGRGKKNLGKGDRPGGRGPDPEAAVEGTGLFTFLPGQNSKTLFRLCHHPICHKSVQTALLRALLSPQAPLLFSLLTTTTSGHHSLSFADEEASLERKTRVPRTERKECILQ